ncbi:MAG: GNAT family N-acetyltransferase [Hyphomicrobiaceae bacterium]
MAPPFVVRRFEIAEAGQLRQLRLSALREMPEAFGAGLHDECGRSPDFWSSWISESPPFGAFIDGEALGMAGFWRETQANLRHRGRLGAMYVSPVLRGQGVAGALIDAVLSHARTCVEQVHLIVNRDNELAVRFYQQAGFVVCGCEPRGHKCGEVYRDALLMVNMLDPQVPRSKPIMR